MPGFDYKMPPPPILTPWSPESLGIPIRGYNNTITLGGSVSGTYPVANKAYFYPFRLDDWATAYQLLFWVGATSAGNINVGIFDSQKNLIVSSGVTAMSATVNTVQELNITDTELPPGDYLLGVACSSATGTTFVNNVAAADEFVLAEMAIYEQAGLTNATFTDPAVPVPCTDSAPTPVGVGIQLVPIF